MPNYEYDGKKWMPGHYWLQYDKVKNYCEKNQNKFPIPKYNLGDTVSFYWNNKAIWRGIVRKISYTVDEPHVQGENRYFGLPILRYDIDSNGHIRWVYENQLL